MADPIVVAVQTTQANDRLAHESERVAKLLGIEPPKQELPVSKTPEGRALQNVNSMADFMVRVAESLEGSAKPAAAKSAAAKQAAANAADGKPGSVTPPAKPPVKP